MRLGIDVSDNQGVINWKKVKAAGVQHAVIRSVRGSGKTDYQFVNNVKGCRKNGIPFDVYKYVYALTEEAAKTEMEQVCALLKENGISCTVWYDIEYSGLRALGAVAITKIVKAAESVVAGHGFPFGIYCNLDWYKNVIDTSAFENKFWIARYPSSGTVKFGTLPDESKKPAIRQTLAGWQHSSDGRVDGINGRVDLNIIYDDETRNDDSGVDAEPVLDEEAVRSLQEAMNADNITDENGKRLAVDGDKKTHTTAAIKKILLKAGAFNTSTARYGVGSTGEVVKWVQMRLNSVIGNEIVKLTGSKYGLNPDGKLGNDTRLAIGLFQEIRGLKVDYIAGMNTITELLVSV